MRKCITSTKKTEGQNYFLGIGILPVQKQLSAWYRQGNKKTKFMIKPNEQYTHKSLTK